MVCLPPLKPIVQYCRLSAVSQITFIDNCCLPLWEAWSEFVHPECMEIVETLRFNRQWHVSWKQAAEAAAAADANAEDATTAITATSAAVHCDDKSQQQQQQPV
jgi:hypothetical protein